MGKFSMSKLYKRHNHKAARDYHLSLGNVDELTLDVPIDHFTNNGTPSTYQMRYLIDESYVNGT